MGRSCNQNGVGGRFSKILTGKPTGKRPLGRPRLTVRQEDNIRMDLEEICINAGN